MSVPTQCTTGRQRRIPFLQAAINRRTKLRIETLRALSVDIVIEATDRAGLREKTYVRRVADVYRLNIQIFRRKFGMNFLMNLSYQLCIIGILSVGGWLLLHGKSEVGTVVAFISGLCIALSRSVVISGLLKPHIGAST